MYKEIAFLFHFIDGTRIGSVDIVVFLGLYFRFVAGLGRSTPSTNAVINRRTVTIRNKTFMIFFFFSYKVSHYIWTVSGCRECITETVKCSMLWKEFCISRSSFFWLERFRMEDKNKHLLGLSENLIILWKCLNFVF